MNENKRHDKIDVITAEQISKSSNSKVRIISQKIRDKDFLERVKSYTETYWDQKGHVQWSGPASKLCNDDKKSAE